MQNKKLLSVLLALVLVVGCVFGVLTLGAQAEERTAVTWTVGTEAESLADALSDAAAKTDWTASDALVIDLNGTSEEVTVDANGILFGLATIFDNSGARLPITIQNGTLTIPEGFEGNMVCANSYTFKGLTFPIADYAVDFWAGSGKVVLDTVVLSTQETPTVETSAKGDLYADCPVAEAFAGWSKPDGLVEVGLELKNVNYKFARDRKGSVNPGVNVSAVHDTDGFTAENVSAADLAVELIVTDSNIQEIWLRDPEALSPVASLKFTMNDTSGNNSKMRLGRLSGIGRTMDADVKVTYPDFDFEVEINGGKVDWSSSLHRAASYTGDFTVTINDGVFAELITTYGDSAGRIVGDCTLNVNGGTFTSSSLFGVDAADAAHSNTNNIYGGTFVKFQGSRISTVLTNNIRGGTFTTFCGTYDTKNGGGDIYVTNNIYGGTFETYYGTGGTASSAENDSGNYYIRNATNNMYGGTITGIMYGCGRQQRVYYVENNLNGTEILGNFCGTANKGSTTMACYAVCNTLTASKIHGNYNGGFTTMEKSNKHTDSDGTYNLKNKVLGGEVVGRFKGNSDASVMGNIINIISGGNFCTSTDYADRGMHFYASGHRAGQGVVTTITGGNFYKSFIGASAQESTASAKTTITGGSFAIYDGQEFYTDSYGNPYYTEIAFQEDGTIVSRADAAATEITIGGTTYPLPIAKGGENYDAIQAAATRPTTSFVIYGADSLMAGATIELNLLGGTYGTVYGNSGTTRIPSLLTVNVKDAKVTTLYGVGSVAKEAVINISGSAEVTNLYAMGGANGTHVEGEDTVNNTVEVNITGGYVKDVYSNLVNATGDVTINGTSPTIYDRDELADHLDELTKIYRSRGVAAHNVKLTGNLSYNFTGVNFSAGTTSMNLSVGDVTGNVNAVFTNCYVNARYSDVAGSSSSVRADINGDAHIKFKNCMMTQINQIINRSGAFKKNFTLELDSVRFSGAGNMKPMNGVGGTANIYIYGDIVLDTASSFISTHRYLGTTYGHIGVKPGEDGALIPVPTTISGEGYVTVRSEKISDQTSSDKDNGVIGYLDVYDVTLDGADIRWHNTAANPDTVCVTTLKGDISLLNGAKVWADTVESDAMVTVASDTWNPGETYVTLTDEVAMAKIRGQIVGIAAGYPAREGLTLVGKAFSTPSASMSVEERIYLNLWLPAADVEDYFANDVLNTKGEAALDWSVLMDKDLENEVFYSLGSGSIKEEDLAAMLVGDYYKIEKIGAVAANDFDKEISFEGNPFSVTATILEICEAGLDGEYTAAELDLFAALYNYGASVCIDPATDEFYDEFKEMSDEFVIDDNAADVVISAVATDKIAFNKISLLMADAIGVRFSGTPVAADTVVTMTLNGEPVNSFYYSVIDGRAVVDIHVSADAFTEELAIVIYTDGEAALQATLSIDGYVEQVKGMGNAEYAMAQLVQACINAKA